MLQSSKKVIDNFEIVKLIAKNIGINKTKKLLLKNIYNQLYIINSQDVKNVYDDEYFDAIVHQKPAREINGIAINSYIDISIKYFEKILNKNIRILDFGCGAGNFVLALGSLGFNVDGFDYYEKGIIDANKKVKELKINDICRFYSDEKQIDKVRYNFIILSDVIEHISRNEFKVLLEKLRNYLVEGGEIIFHTPNGNMHEWCPKRKKVFDLYFFIKNLLMIFRSEEYQLEKLKQAFYDQVHINIMTPKELISILKEFSFNDFEIIYDEIFWNLLLKFKISGSFWLKCKKLES